MRTVWFGKTGAAAAFFAAMSVAPMALTQSGGAEGEIGVQARPTVSAADQLAQAETIQNRAKALATRMTKMLDEARRDKDIMRANCINQKLTEVNATVRNIEQRSKSLSEAAAAGDDGRRNHEYTVLSVLSQRVDSLERDAAQCLGQSLYEPGESQIITTIEEGSPVYDPTLTVAPPAIIPTFVIPPPLSPFF
jgi:hypothetical protein